MVVKTVACTFDKDAVWEKVRGRRPVVLDTNCWINMGDNKSPAATRIKGTLRKLVSDGAIFCPLSFGLVVELYKQAENSRLRTAALMDELSLRVSYANREEIFAWEVERAVCRIADAGPIDLSLYGLYVPVLAYLSSQFQLDFPEEFPLEHTSDFIGTVKGRMESLTLTELLRMRAGRKEDRIFDFVKHIPAPKYSEAAKRTWDVAKGDRTKIERIEAEIIFAQYIQPAIVRLSLPVQAKFLDYLRATPKDRYGGCLGGLLNHLPAIHNHIELLTAIAQNPTRRDKINDFFDLEMMPVPLAYASVFVSKDKGIRDVLRNRTEILKRNACRYCCDLAELEEWLTTEGLA
jgi:hypothetical protein